MSDIFTTHQDWNNRRSRLNRHVQQNLGVIYIGKNENQIYRKKSLHVLDTYYNNKQYDGMPDFDVDCDSMGTHIPIRKRQPRIKYSYAKNLVQRVASKLLGVANFPSFKVDDSPEDEEFIKAVINNSMIRSEMIEPMRKLLAVGSVFVRFKIDSGVFKISHYDSKYCYPEFQPNGELERVVVKYIYQDENERDEKGNFVKKWFKAEFNTVSEVLYDNPPYVLGTKQEPVFEVVEEFEHELGFVQGEWLTTSSGNHSPDGYSLIEDITDFIDELNYSISQSSKAISYNQDPQLVFSGMNDDEMQNVIRSSTKSWNLGREGSAQFVESNLTGADKALLLRDKMVHHISDLTRIVLLDPEKIVGSAQSAKAMEVLHGPFKDLVEELREPVGKHFIKIVTKLCLICFLADKMGIVSPIVIPPGYSPQSFNIVLKWPELFPLTIEDMQKKTNLAVSAHNGRLISRFTAMRYIQEIFGIQNLEEEAAQIDKEPVFNPFGGF